jgi:hypothetical protein
MGGLPGLPHLHWLLGRERAAPAQVPSRFRSLPHARAKTHFVQFKSEALRGINTALPYFSLVYTTALP